MDNRPQRKNIRLKYYDYRSKGAYHVTICARGRECIFGTVRQGQMMLNELGRLADQNIGLIPGHSRDVEVIDHVVMPNHVHILMGFGIQDGATSGPTLRNTLGQIVSAYKASVTRAYGRPVWQPRYYEHIIRNERDLRETVEYIDNNPAAWEKDDMFIDPAPIPPPP